MVMIMMMIMMIDDDDDDALCLSGVQYGRAVGGRGGGPGLQSVV